MWDRPESTWTIQIHPHNKATDGMFIVREGQDKDQVNINTWTSTDGLTHQVKIRNIVN
jgi:uncharacterized protein Veg